MFPACIRSCRLPRRDSEHGRLRGHSRAAFDSQIPARPGAPRAGGGIALRRGAGADAAGQRRLAVGPVRHRRGRAASLVWRSGQAVRLRTSARSSCVGVGRTARLQGVLGCTHLDPVLRPQRQSGDAVRLLPPFDCCRAAQNLLLAAHARALGSCWVGAPLPWLASPGVAAELDLPAGFDPVVAVVLGVPAEQLVGSPRAVPEIRWCGSPP